MPPTEEGIYLTRNKSISATPPRIINVEGKALRESGYWVMMDAAWVNVNSLWNRWWYGPLPNAPMPSDGFNTQVEIESEEERRAISIK